MFATEASEQAAEAIVGTGHGADHGVDIAEAVGAALTGEAEVDKEIVQDIVNDAIAAAIAAGTTKIAADGRKIWYDAATGIIAILNPNKPSSSTAYVPMDPQTGQPTGKHVFDTFGK